MFGVGIGGLHRALPKHLNREAKNATANNAEISNQDASQYNGFCKVLFPDYGEVDSSELMDVERMDNLAPNNIDSLQNFSDINSTPVPSIGLSYDPYGALNYFQEGGEVEDTRIDDQVKIIEGQNTFYNNEIYINELSSINDRIVRDLSYLNMIPLCFDIKDDGLHESSGYVQSSGESVAESSVSDSNKNQVKNALDKTEIKKSKTREYSRKYREKPENVEKIRNIKRQSKERRRNDPIKLEKMRQQNRAAVQRFKQKKLMQAAAEKVNQLA